MSLLVTLTHLGCCETVLLPDLTPSDINDPLTLTTLSSLSTVIIGGERYSKGLLRDLTEGEKVTLNHKVTVLSIM